MIIALKKSKFLSNFVKHVDWLIGEQVTSCLGETYKINKCRYSIDSMGYLKYLYSRLKYDRNTRDAKQELKDNILGEDIIKVLREFRDGNL